MEEEIDIRRIIDAFKKNFLVFLTAILISVGVYVIVSLLMPVRYVATTSLMVNRATTLTDEGEIRKMGFPAEFYVTLLNDKNFLMDCYSKLNLLPSERPKLKAKSQSDILFLESKAQDKELAEQVLKAVVEQLFSYIEKIKDSQKSMLNVISEDRKALEERMTKLADKIARFKKEKDLEGLQRTLLTYSSLIKDYEAQMLRLNDEIKMAEMELSEIEKHLKNVEEKLKLTKSLGSDITLYEASKSVSNKKVTELLRLKTEDEVLNPLYLNLKSRHTDLTIKLTDLKNREGILKPKLNELITKANELEKELITLNKELGDMQLEYESIKSMYLEFVKNETRAQSFGSYTVGGLSQLSGIAVSQEGRLTPKGIAIALMCGCIIGGFVCLFKERVI